MLLVVPEAPGLLWSCWVSALSKFRDQFGCWKALPNLRSSSQVHSEGVFASLSQKRRAEEDLAGFAWPGLNHMHSHSVVLPNWETVGNLVCMSREKKLWILESVTTCGTSLLHHLNHLYCIRNRVLAGIPRWAKKANMNSSFISQSLYLDVAITDHSLLTPLSSDERDCKLSLENKWTVTEALPEAKQQRTGVPAGQVAL